LASDTERAESEAKAKVSAVPSESAVRPAKAKQTAERESARKSALSTLRWSASG